MAIVVTKMSNNLFAKYSDISAHVIGAWGARERQCYPIYLYGMGQKDDMLWWIQIPKV